MNKFKLIFTVVIIICTSLGQAIALPMDFTLIPPDKPASIFGNAWRIYADGEIDKNTATKLREIIQRNSIPDRSIIYLNSRGGSLMGGMELGEVIRKYGLYTNVAKLISIKKTPTMNGESLKQGITENGICFSACVFSYIGGEFRFLQKNSLIGVHRFYSNSNPIGSDETQIASSVLIQYFKRMGVKETLYSEMAKAGADAINILSRDLAINLQLVYDGYENTKWSIESIEGGLYVKGERKTWRGINKFLLSCDILQKILVATFIFDAEGRSEEILKMKSISIFLDSTDRPAVDYLLRDPVAINNIVTAHFSLPKEILSGLLNSQVTGISFQYSYDSPVFLGFVDMGLSGGKESIQNIIQICRK